MQQLPLIQFDLRARPYTRYEAKRGDVGFHRQVQKNGKNGKGKRQGHKESRMTAVKVICPMVYFISS